MSSEFYVFQVGGSSKEVTDANRASSARVLPVTIIFGDSDIWK